MAGKRKPTRTEDYLKVSRELRARIDAMLKDVGELAHSESDVISASAAIASESVEWKTAVDRTSQELQRAAAHMKARRDQVAEEYVDRFRRTLTSAGHDVYGEGSLLIVGGIVHVEFDLANAKAKINGAPQSDLSFDAFQNDVETELRALTRALTEPREFASQLQRAYEHVVAIAKLSVGSQVMTTDLLPSLLLQRQSTRFLADPTTSSFAPYPLSWFRADLFNLLKSETAASGGFHWAPGSNTRGAVFMFVPALGRATHVGRVWFDHNTVEA